MSNLTALKGETGISEANLAGNPDLWFEQKFEEHMKKREEAHVPSMAIVVTKGTLDWAYPPFILDVVPAARAQLRALDLSEKGFLLKRALVLLSQGFLWTQDEVHQQTGEGEDGHDQRGQHLCEHVWRPGPHIAIGPDD